MKSKGRGFAILKLNKIKPISDEAVKTASKYEKSISLKRE